MGASGGIFQDREDAGRQLGAALLPFRDQDPLVLALPRGGVPVAFEVARMLGCPLDVVLVRKIGAPGQEELALGAIVDGAQPQVVLNEDIVRAVSPRPEYMATVERRELAEIERRRKLYGGGKEETGGRTVIVVDDGVATGATAKAALRALRKTNPRRLVLAVPVAPTDSLSELADSCDEIVCLSTPEPFYAVGAYYGDFGQTSDQEVIELLAQARQTRS